MAVSGVCYHQDKHANFIKNSTQVMIFIQSMKVILLYSILTLVSELFTGTWQVRNEILIAYNQDCYNYNVRENLSKPFISI